MTNMLPTLTFKLPTVSSTSNSGMDLSLEPYPNNYDEVRGRNSFTNKITSRDSSMSSSMSSVTYHERMAMNNVMNVNKVMNDNSPTLSYEDEQEKALQVSKVAEQQSNIRLQGNSLNAPKSNPQCVLNEEQ